MLEIIFANSIPLFGVLFLGSDAFQIVAVYWVEIVVFGCVTAGKIATCDPDPAEVDLDSMGKDEKEAWKPIVRQKRRSAHSPLRIAFSRLFESLAFATTYFFSCFVLLMVTAYAFGAGRDVGEGDIDVTLSDLKNLPLGLMVMAAAVSATAQIRTCYCDFLGKGEYRRTVANLLILQAYGQAFLFYAAVFAGAWLAVMLGQNMGVLLVLIFGKTVFELLVERRKQ